jgi:hypothetical protein
VEAQEGKRTSLQGQWMCFSRLIHSSIALEHHSLLLLNIRRTYKFIFLLAMKAKDGREKSPERRPNEEKR